MRLTLGAARPTIAKVIGVCADSDTVPFYLNQAVERLLPRGKWKGTFQRYRTCINSACITLPRHFECVEGFALCGCPGMIRKLSSGGYRLYSRKKNPKTGRRRNLGTFKTRAAAEKHEQAVQYFKRH